MKIKLIKKRKIELFDPIKIKLLVKLSYICSDYLNSDEDQDINSVMELDYTPSGMYLEQSGIVFISDDGNDANIEMIEGIHFELI